MNNKKQKKERIDNLVVKYGLAQTCEKAKRLIMAELIFADEEKITKPGKLVSVDAIIKTKKQASFVGRGGDKLNGFFSDYQVNIKDKICLDVGSSTGGFTDCLLSKEAKKVYAVDVGKGQLDWKLRNDPRVIVKEGVNARYISSEIISELCDIIVMDVSFISIEKILGSLYNLLTYKGIIIALIKPQFEARREKIGEKGIVKDISVHKEVIKKIEDFAEKINLTKLAVFPSKVIGTKGNQEYFIALQKNEENEKIRNNS